MGDHLEIATDFDPEVPPVLADLAQLEQIVVDVALEARDRMPAGGRLTLATKSARVDPEFAEAHPGLRPGRYAVLVMRNSELSLAARRLIPCTESCAKVVGTLRFRKSRGWSRLHALPSSRRTTHTRGTGSDCNRRVGRRDDSAGDDEEQVRALGRRVLERVGYTVLTAADTQEAIQIAKPAPRDHPSAAGRHGASRLQRSRTCGPIDDPSPRDQGALYLRHHRRDHRTTPGAGSRTAFLQKPFSLDHLVRKVRQVLDVPQTAR
jgi:CheY-like chemotaxis protein